MLCSPFGMYGLNESKTCILLTSLTMVWLRGVGRLPDATAWLLDVFGMAVGVLPVLVGLAPPVVGCALPAVGVVLADPQAARIAAALPAAMPERNTRRDIDRPVLMGHPHFHRCAFEIDYLARRKYGLACPACQAGFSDQVVMSACDRRCGVDPFPGLFRALREVRRAACQSGLRYLQNFPDTVGKLWGTGEG